MEHKNLLITQSFYFDIHTAEEEQQLDEMNLQYASSSFHNFDSKLMSLKKII